MYFGTVRDSDNHRYSYVCCVILIVRCQFLYPETAILRYTPSLLPAIMAVLHSKPYSKYILHASLMHRDQREDVTYAVISEFISEHKTPPDRFVIYPQISLRWKPDDPKDVREEVPDFGLGNFTHQTPYFKLRIGAEAKRSLEVMASLPEPSVLETHLDVLSTFHSLFYQGEDQAKAAIKGRQTFLDLIPFLLFVGPYWVSVRYGPFTPNELGVRTHKSSDSADFLETTRAIARFNAQPIRRRLYLLGTNESTAELERVISSTDHLAENLRAEAAQYSCMFIIILSLFMCQWRLQRFCCALPDRRQNVVES